MASFPPARPDAPTRLLKERVRKAFRHLPKALAGEEEALHQLRVWGRRLRVALPLLARKPRGKRVRRSRELLREMTRTAGTSRDLDVMVGLLDDHLRQQERAAGGVAPELKVLRRRLLDSRRRSRRRMAEGMLDLEIARLRRDLRAVVSRKAEGLFTVLLRLRQARALEGERLSEAIIRMQDEFDPERLHRLRIQARRLRYTAEILDAVRGQQSEAPVLFRQLQELLGRIHDAYVLSRWAAAQEARTRARGPAGLADRAGALEAHFRERSREHHRQLLAAQPLELVRRALAAMGQGRSAA